MQPLLLFFVILMRCNLTNCTNEGFNSFHLSPFFLIRNFIKKDLANYRGISNQIRIKFVFFVFTTKKKRIS